MENFFYEGVFIEDLHVFIDTILDYKESVEDLPDDFEAVCYESKLEPILTLSANWITNRLDDDRFSENGIDIEIEKIQAVLDKHINYEEINKAIPALYYEDRTKKFIINKQDLLTN